jgi:hypothetical protein
MDPPATDCDLFKFLQGKKDKRKDEESVSLNEKKDGEVHTDSDQYKETVQ